MLIILAVNLYSSRIVLQELGVEDYGIYNIVGGVVAMFAFLNTTMSGATSRFLTYEAGKNNVSKLKDTFKASLSLHCLIALIIILFSETIGLWFVNNKLVIPENKMDIANIVYQISILTISVKTIQVPFNASIISHERMDVYAFIEIANALIIIGFLFLLQLFDFGKLIIYSLMLLFVAVCVLLMYCTYCLRKYKECTVKFSADWHIMKPMLVFSGFDLYGNMCVTARTQGINIILNIFFGTVINAAAGIATQIQAAILMISSNVSMAFRPQIIKNYAVGQIRQMEKLVNTSSIISVLLFSIVAIPLFIEMPLVLDIWLKTPPKHTESIARISILVCWLGALNSVLTIPIHATGKIKVLSLCGGTIYLMTIPVAYFCVKFFEIPEVAYITMLVFMVVLLCSTSIILKRLIPQFSNVRYWLKSILNCVLCILFSTICVVTLTKNIDEGILRLLTIGIAYALLLFVSVFIIVCNKEQRHNILKYIINKYNKIRK